MHSDVVLIGLVVVWAMVAWNAVASVAGLKRSLIVWSLIILGLAVVVQVALSLLDCSLGSTASVPFR